jgi:predicted secreted protein
MTLDDGDYELVLEQDQGFSEDPTTVAENLTESPNQSSEVSDIPAPSPTQERKPPCIHQYFNLLQLAYILCILHYV